MIYYGLSVMEKWLRASLKNKIIRGYQKNKKGNHFLLPLYRIVIQLDYR